MFNDIHNPKLKKIPSRYRKEVNKIINEYLDEYNNLIEPLENLIDEQTNKIQSLKEVIEPLEDLVDEQTKEIAELKKEKSRFEFIRLTSNTGFPNINALINEWHDKDIEKTCVFIYEIDDLIIINDILGSDETNKALKTISKYLEKTIKRQLSNKALLKKYKTGSSFVFPISKIEKVEAERLYNILNDDDLYKDLNDELISQLRTSIEINFNVGFCIYNKSYQLKTLKDMIYCAKQAITKARKSRDSDHIQFIFEKCSNVQDYLLNNNLYQKLNTSIENQCEGFYIVYQPQICLKNKKIYGYEALLRWKLDGKLINPSSFIKAAEETLTINKLGKWLIKNVCIQIQEWKINGHFEDKKVSINLSGKQLLKNGLQNFITRTTTRYDISPSDISFEITESVPLNKTIIHNINKLEAKNYQIAIDDYGTGCASLEHISDIEYKILKIDKRFLDDVKDGYSKHLNILESIFDFANKINVSIIIEGVEKDVTGENVFNLINKYQCIVQGYYFSKPLHSDTVIEWSKNFESNKTDYIEHFSCLIS